MDNNLPCSFFRDSAAPLPYGHRQHKQDLDCGGLYLAANAEFNGNLRRCWANSNSDCYNNSDSHRDGDRYCYSDTPTFSDANT